MKRFRFLFVALTLVLGLAACQNEEPVAPSPIIKLGASEVELTSDGVAVSVAYIIENGVEGEHITVDNVAEWLTVNTDRARTIELSATPNEGGDARCAELTIGYAGAESVALKVVQAGFVSPLKIEVIGVGSTDITFTVITSDEELTWIPMVTYKSYYDEVGSDNALFEEDMEYFRYLAEVYDQTLEEFLTDMVATGSQENIYFGGLDTETEYVLYVYGITVDGRRTTDIVAAAFTTEPPYEGDITFDFEVTEQNYVMEFVITPSHTGVPYYYGVASEAKIEEWMATYATDDLREAIQQGEINYSIEQYMDWGYIEEVADYYFMYSESDIMDWGYFNCDAATKYILYAAKWNEECQLVGELSTFEYTTSEVGPSDNELTLSVDEVTQSSARATVTTTNDDPYTVIPVRSDEIEGLSDDEIVGYLVGAYDYLMDEYEFEGDMSRVYKRMRPDSNYTFLAFGYLAGVRTTPISKASFTTLPTGDPADCTFEFSAEPDTDYAWVEVTPSDKGLYYHWMVYPASYTSDDAKAYIRLMVDDWYDGDFNAFASWELSQGDESQSVWDLLPDTEYKVGAVIMDYDSGEFLTDMHFGEVFRTLPVVYADLTINVDFGPYYDLAALVAAGYAEYEEYLSDGDAILPVTVTVDGDCAEFYYDIYNNDLSDTEIYPDDIFYDGLWYGSWYESTTFVVSYDKPQTLVAIAYDNDYNCTPLYRAVITPTADGSSPVEEYVATASVKALSAGVPSASSKMGRKRNDRQADAQVQLEARRAEGMANVEAIRKASAKAEIEARMAHKSLSGRAIAK